MTTLAPLTTLSHSLSLCIARSQFPTYTQYVTNPIDLGTIRKRIASLMHYSTVNELLDDVKLLAENAQR